MTQPTYLGVSHSAFATGDPSTEGYRPPNLSLSAGVDGHRLDDRRGLLAQFDRMRRDVDDSGLREGLDGFQTSALQMLTNPRIAEAFDLGKEDPRLRDRYGRHLWGQSCCSPAAWPRPAPASSRSMRWPRRSAIATSAGTTTSTPRPAGTWPTPCAIAPRSWTRPSRR